jgi:hypothetical protein
MIARRRFTRYVLPAPAEGRARTISDCVVERWDGESAVVVTAQPALPDDVLMLQFTAAGGAMTVHPVRVVFCLMEPQHGPLRFRLHVRVTSEGQPAAPNCQSVARS